MLVRSLVTLSIYVVACFSLGHFAAILIRRISSSARDENDSGLLKHWGLDFAFGSALLSVIWLILGLAGQLRSGAIWVILVVLAAMALGTFLRKSRYLQPFSFRPYLGQIRTDIPLFILMLLTGALALWLGILAYVRPPFGDADAFYMTYPKIMAATGRLEAMVGGYREFSSIGLSGELHFAALMVIGNPAMAKLFTWIAGIGVLVLLKDVTRLVGGGRVAQGMTIAILLTSTTFSDYLSDGKTDLFAALLGMGAVYCVLLLRRSPAPVEYIIIAGLMTGFSLAAKVSFIIAFLPAVALLAVMQIVISLASRGDESAMSFWNLFSYSLIFSVSVFVALLPHLIKNQMLFGNALAPFVGMKGNWADQPTWYAVSDTVWIVATYPLALVYGLYPLMGGGLSFLWLAALPLIYVINRKDFTLQNPVMQVSLAACAGLVCWLAIKPSIFAPRYILPTLVMLIPLPALAVERIWNQERRPRVVSYGYAVLAVVALGSAPFTAPAGVWTALPGKIIHYIRSGAPECGLAISSYCSGLNAINASSTRGERVFLAGYYSYYLRPDLLQCINSPDELTLFNQPSPADVWSGLYSKGFAYVAVQKATHGHLLKSLDLQQVPPWLAVSVAFADSDMPIFHIRTTDGRRHPDVACVPKGRKLWGLASDRQG